ncbi:ribosome small subunit-dependent GTPase A [Mumia sp. zg.B53]|nr:ribosome small subunit-dependent GTPase A [Mumia sp. zg.B53]
MAPRDRPGWRPVALDRRGVRGRGLVRRRRPGRDRSPRPRRCDARPPRRGRARPGGRRRRRTRLGAVDLDRDRSPPRPRDRPSRRARRRDQPTRWRGRGRHRPADDPSASPARRHAPDVRRPPDGTRGGRARARGQGRPCRGRRDDRQDLPGLRAGLGAVRVVTQRYDEDRPHEQFDRPRRHTRPRTKERPSYDDAETGWVVGIDRGRYGLLVGDDDRVVTAMKSRSLGRKAVVVGDRVRIVGDTSGTHDTLARIVEVEDRTTVLRRTADDNDPIERVIVANADQMVIVTALADPPPRPRLIERCLVAAFDAGMRPLVCLTKSDLGDPDPLVAMLVPLEVDVVVTHRGGDLEMLRERLRGRTSVLVGHSGVGKSTLVNALVPDAELATGDVNAVSRRGRHTSTSTHVLPLPFGGWIVDTPGIRSFGLAHVSIDRLLAAFPDLSDVTEECPRGCQHTVDDPECALDVAVSEGRLDAARVDSFRRLVVSREDAD